MYSFSTVMSVPVGTVNKLLSITELPSSAGVPWCNLTSKALYTPEPGLFGSVGLSQVIASSFNELKIAGPLVTSSAP